MSVEIERGIVVAVTARTVAQVELSSATASLAGRKGKLVWETKLPFSGIGTPSTYEVSGRQVIPAGGGKASAVGTDGKPISGGLYVAFSLPSNSSNSLRGSRFK
jgi:hypothetical protein